MGGAQHCVLKFAVQQYFICSVLYSNSNVSLWRWAHRRAKGKKKNDTSAAVLRSQLLMSERFKLAAVCVCVKWVQM